MAHWLEHSPGSHIDFREDSGSFGLCPHTIPMALVNSLTWATLTLGGGRAEEGIENRVKYKPDCVTLLLNS